MIEEIEPMTGEAGNLASLARWSHGMNAGITKAMDGLLGPEGTDSFDASCNTCKHFAREQFDRKTHLVSIWGFPGKCGLTGKPTTGQPRGMFCGMPCYINRRTGLNSADGSKLSITGS